MSNSTLTTEGDNLKAPVQKCDSHLECCDGRCLRFSVQYIGKFLINLIAYIFGYSLCSRLFTLILILEAAVLWIGYSLNSVLQLLFIPLAYSSNNSTTNINLSFLLCCLVLPGVISFSSHYFWFIVQFAFHCYSNKETKEENRIEKDDHFLKGRQQGKTIDETDQKNSDEALLCFPQNKHIYRSIITSLMTLYVIFRKYYYLQDIFTANIVAFGLFPLGLMWLLHFMHLYGIWYFVTAVSFDDKKSGTEPPESTTHPVDKNTDESVIQYVPTSTLLAVMVLITCISYKNKTIVSDFEIPYNIYITCALFATYILLNSQVPMEIDNMDNDEKCCGCCLHESSSDEKKRFRIHRFFGRLYGKIIRVSLSMEKNKNFHLYKLFILIILYVMLIPLNKILTNHFYEYKFWILVFILKPILILLWLPPISTPKINQWIEDKQMHLVKILIIIMCLASIVSIIIFLFVYVSNVRIELLFLFFLMIYAGLLSSYYTGYWKKPTLTKWAKSHESVGIYKQAFSAMFILLSLIGFFGISFGIVVYAETKPNENDSLLNQYTLSGSSIRFDDDEGQQYKMQACYWNFANFNIQDMTLFAALAYMPTETLKSELKHFYRNNEVIFDDEFHNYQEYGYGQVTYYTLDTPEAVIVVIRGTTLSYEWLIDFDIWTEATISQMISIFFPWSRLYPRSVQKIIVNQMSLLENILAVEKSTSDNDDQLRQLSKRYYVKNMIHILKQINMKYKNKPLILVGHSLGGGLAKLAGIAFNNTVLIVSVSGPGISYSRAKYTETQTTLMDTINKRKFNIIHDRDIVPWVDQQGGLIQYITCPKIYSRLQCHSINLILCTLLKNCGNPKQLQINQDICHP